MRRLAGMIALGAWLTGSMAAFAVNVTYLLDLQGTVLPALPTGPFVPVDWRGTVLVEVDALGDGTFSNSHIPTFGVTTNLVTFPDTSQLSSVTISGGNVASLQGTVFAGPVTLTFSGLSVRYDAFATHLAGPTIGSPA